MTTGKEQTKAMIVTQTSFHVTYYEGSGSRSRSGNELNSLDASETGIASTFEAQTDRYRF